MTAAATRKALHTFASKKKARTLQSFFKTGPGQYGEGDIFIGARVPEVRSVAGEFSDLKQSEITKLLHSKVHEERLLALLILVEQFSDSSPDKQRSIYEYYLKNTQHINNWDLVDLSADKIVGAFLVTRSRKPLYRLAKSSLLWDRRIAIVATFTFIKQGDISDTLGLSAQLLNDDHDLMHKACGWMLREAGKKDQKSLEQFLVKFGKQMPRTMLRYSIERLPEKKRVYYLKSTRS